MTFPKIKVEITRFVYDYNPGFVECRLVDASGSEWLFVEKIPIVTRENLDADSSYPKQGVIACRIIEKKYIANREVFRVNTKESWGVESTTGDFDFDIFPEQLLVLIDS